MGRGESGSARQAANPGGRLAAVSPAARGAVRGQMQLRVGSPAKMWAWAARGAYKGHMEMPTVASRETLQNSVDAIRRAQLITRLGREGKSPEEICDLVWPGCTDPQLTANHLETVAWVLAHPVERGRFEVVLDPTRGTIEWRDNGVGMNDAELQEHFLSLGGSDKQSDAMAVGGFGMAKAVILGCSEAWEIVTRDCVVDGDTLLARQSEPLAGTTIRALDVPAARAEDEWRRRRIVAAHREILALSDPGPDIDIFFTIVGEDGTTTTEQIRPAFTPSDNSRKRFELDLPAHTTFDVHHFQKEAVVGLDNLEHEVVVRLNGLVQYHTWIGRVPGTLVVDLTTSARPQDPDYPLLPNREGLRDKADKALDKVIEAFRENPISLTKPNDAYSELYFHGKSQERDRAQEQDEMVTRADPTQLVAAARALIEALPEEERRAVEVMLAGGDAPAGGRIAQLLQGSLAARIVHAASASQLEAAENPLDSAWKIKRRTNFTEKFDEAKHVELLLLWQYVVSKTAEAARAQGLSGVPEESRVGFLLDKDVVDPDRREGTVAMLERRVRAPRPGGGTEEADYVLLNPFGVRRANPGAVARQLRALAAHELAHYYAGHDETFASVEGRILQASAVYEDDMVEMAAKTGAHRQVKGEVLLHPREQEAADRRLCPLDDQRLDELAQAVEKLYYETDEMSYDERKEIEAAIDTVRAARHDPDAKGAKVKVREASRRLVGIAEALGWRVNPKRGVIGKGERLTRPSRDQAEQWLDEIRDAYCRDRLTYEEMDEADQILRKMRWYGERVPYAELPEALAKVNALLAKGRADQGRAAVEERLRTVTAEPATPWNTLLEQVIRAYGGEAKLEDIYAALEHHEKAKLSETWRQTVRCTLQRSRRFAPGNTSGAWRIAGS